MLTLIFLSLVALIFILSRGAFTPPSKAQPIRIKTEQSQQQQRTKRHNTNR